MPGPNYHLLVLGDSVPWGQGLKEPEKHHSLVLDWIRRFHPDLSLSKEVMAHSGAVIGMNAPRGLPFVDGEVPNDFPSILDQVFRFTSDPAQIDLVLVNGGINDVGVDKIFNPLTRSSDLSIRIRQHCFVDLKLLLHELHARIPGAHTRFLISSYYPVLSNESDALRIPIFCQLFGIGLANFLFPRNPVAKVIANSLLFWNESTRLISDAVDQVNVETGSNRFHLVKPAFEAVNAAFAPQPWVFGIKANTLPQDEIAAQRALACIRDEDDLLQRELCFRASAGHPNRWGSQAYFNATFPILQREFGL